MWPEKFINQMEELLDSEASLFFKCLRDPPPVSIRKNPKKAFSITEKLDPVPWHSDGYYLKKRPRFVLDPLFHGGAYYVQEASSMILHKIILDLGLDKQPLITLDLCAAPGGKSTLLASTLHEKSLILCNEVHSKRYNILTENVEKWGYPNIYTCSHDPKRFQNLAGFFDLLLVDAPCSGEGLFRKDPNAIDHWSEEQIMFCAARQKRILADAIPLVKKNGILIYSTCTYNQEENLKNIAWIKKQGFEPISIPVVEKFGFVEISNENGIGYQAYPHKVKGEGFFVSALRCLEERGPSIKKGRRQIFSWKKEKLRVPFLKGSAQSTLFRNTNNAVVSIPFHHHEIIQSLSEKIHIHPIELARMKGKNFVPAHGLALSILLETDMVNKKTLNKKQALQFLRKEPIEGLNFDQGWQWISHKDLGLGWIKGIGKRYNNYFPAHLRIRTKD